jgi:hypothetical protein
VSGAGTFFCVGSGRAEFHQGRPDEDHSTQVRPDDAPEAAVTGSTAHEADAHDMEVDELQIVASIED